MSNIKKQIREAESAALAATNRVLHLKSELVTYENQLQEKLHANLNTPCKVAKIGPDQYAVKVWVGVNSTRFHIVGLTDISDGDRP